MPAVSRFNVTLHQIVNRNLPHTFSFSTLLPVKTLKLFEKMNNINSYLSFAPKHGYGNWTYSGTRSGQTVWSYLAATVTLAQLSCLSEGWLMTLNNRYTIKYQIMYMIRWVREMENFFKVAVSRVDINQAWELSSEYYWEDKSNIS